MKGVLEGIRILELGNFISGPYAAVLLSDMGAEVIKVENPKGGDPFRGWDLGGDQPNFWAFNRGKKSLTFNLQTPEGKEIFYGPVKQADVVIENYRPGVTKKLGIDYETLKKINGRIICCSITGTGPTGPYVHRPAYDTVGQGLGGMLSVLMDPKNPRPIGPAYADHLSGLYSAVGVLGALVARAQTLMVAYGQNPPIKPTQLRTIRTGEAVVPGACSPMEAKHFPWRFGLPEA